MKTKDLRKEYIKKIRALGFKVNLPRDGKSFDVFEIFISQQTGRIFKKDRAFGWGTCGSENTWKAILEGIERDIKKNNFKAL
jgi:hypothetical protein